ncbi:hypothetical protein OG787_28320 [Streptomyces sp. NBC_00075]|uniref:Carboxymuconolactone decarboxylase-like domain-containing protein n=1 Tax=Streptomyces sp. NBC_00093 TaxID=2975649 RepID=A0AAU2A462_9ACTN
MHDRGRHSGRGQGRTAPARDATATCRSAHRRRTPYEIHHHENIGRLLGLDEAGTAAAGSGSAEGLTAEQTAVLSLTDRLLEQHTLTEPERAEALTFLTAGQLSDLVLTIGFYQLVCNFLNTLPGPVPKRSSSAPSSPRRAPRTASRPAT